MSYRIFITGSGIAEEAQQLLTAENCSFAVGDPKDSIEELAKKLNDFNTDGLIVRQGKITASVQQAAANLRVICKHGVGTDNIDIDAATKLGLPVMYTPSANYKSVAEHTFALIFALARKITIEDGNIRKGIFDKKDYAGIELFGKTLGIIGFGRIGRRLSELVEPFDMTIIVYDPLRKEWPSLSNITKADKLETLLTRADIISLHCPLTPETRGLIDKQAIQLMKNNVLLINTARGGIVIESDLVEALEKKRIGGAALDVFEVEPPAEDNPLLKLKNIIFTTHVAGISDNSYKNMGLEAVENVLAILNGRPFNPESLLNKEVRDKK